MPTTATRGLTTHELQQRALRAIEASRNATDRALQLATEGARLAAQAQALLEIARVTERGMVR
jgi:hypothetical protein